VTQEHARVLDTVLMMKCLSLLQMVDQGHTGRCKGHHKEQAFAPEQHSTQSGGGNEHLIMQMMQ
jgi:hypothetical protein